MRKKILSTALVIFTLINSYSQAIRLDSSFGNRGLIVVTNPISTNIKLNTYGKKVLIETDGNFYVLLEAVFPGENKTSTLISHFFASGFIDSSFGSNGYSNAVDIQNSTGALDNDGKIVIVGSTLNTIKRNVFALARYNKDGTLDSTFSKDGELIMEFGGFDDQAKSVAIQKDGRIVVVGKVYNANSDFDFALVRYNKDGTLDNTFSKDGKLTTDFGHSEEANSVVIQSDGKIVAAGYTSFSKQGNYSSYFALARFNTDGTLDATFSKDGKQTTDFGDHDDLANAVALQVDGKVVAAGMAFSDFAFARYNTNGTLDSTFSKDGKLTTDFASEYDNAHFVALQSDGKIVAAGEIVDEFESGLGNFGLTRYNTDGTLDTTFANYGKLSSDLGFADIANSLGIQDNGKILVAGTVESQATSPGAGFAIARYNTDGTPDKTLFSNGKQTGNVSSSYTVDQLYSSIAIQTDEKIVAVGNTIFDRYNTDGSLDSTFRVDRTQFASFGSVVSSALQSDGKIVVAGEKGNQGSFALARYNINGRIDSSFHVDSTQKPNLFYATSMAIQTNGKIVVAGSSINDYHARNFTLARYNPDGTLDSTFAKNGMLTDLEEYEESIARSVQIQSDGKLVVINSFITTDPGDDDDSGHSDIARFNSDGSIDSTFGVAGRSVLKRGNIKAFAIQDDRKIVLVVPTFDVPLVRLNTDGTLDTAFGKMGKTNLSISSIDIQSDGKIVVAGSKWNGKNSDFALARYNKDGSIDKSFGSEGIQVTDVSEGNDIINNIAIVGKVLYVAGVEYNATQSNVVGRYLLDNSNSAPPIVTLTLPANNTTRLAPAAHIKLSATAADSDGTITKVEFYNGTHLLHTETVVPYGFVWRNVPLGNYTLTAKAYDNSGLVTTSAPVYISVVPNKPPTISIVKPENNQNFAAPGYIHFEADTKDVDGRITRVEFYNGSTLLNTQYQFPYTFVWKDVPAGTYTITAVATDNWGAHITSAPVTVRIIPGNTSIVSNRPAPVNDKTGIDEAATLRLVPNPSRNVLNVYTTGLQQNKPVTLSVLSSSGVVLKTLQSNSSTKIIQLDVSSLVSGAYTVKLSNRDRILYKQFVKL